MKFILWEFEINFWMPRIAQIQNKSPVVEKLAVDIRPKPFAHPVSPTSLLSSVGRHIGMIFREKSTGLSSSISAKSYPSVKTL